MSSQKRGCCFLHAMFQYSLPINIMDVEPTKKITAYQQAVLLRSPRAQNTLESPAGSDNQHRDAPNITGPSGKPHTGERLQATKTK